MFSRSAEISPSISLLLLLHQFLSFVIYSTQHISTELAVCPNSNIIEIYETKTWSKLHTLTEHDLVITSIDWSAANNKIVSCSHDRNAFVWTFMNATADEPATWKPALVLMNINRAAMDVKWALDGQRFAIGSGDKCVAVCTYDPAGDWWVSKVRARARGGCCRHTHVYVCVRPY